VWCSAVAAAGYALANSWDTLERWIGRTGVIGLVIVVVLFFVVRARARPNT
jgi:membrane protein DedA with SNARE-associated domain